MWFICYYGVYETMFYVFYVHCGSLCLFNYVLSGPYELMVYVGDGYGI
jgi:hypothetical protein